MEETNTQLSSSKTNQSSDKTSNLFRFEEPQSCCSPFLYLSHMHLQPSLSVKADCLYLETDSSAERVVYSVVMGIVVDHVSVILASPLEKVWFLWSCATDLLGCWSPPQRKHCRKHLNWPTVVGLFFSQSSVNGRKNSPGKLTIMGCSCSGSLKETIIFPLLLKGEI